MPKTTIKVSKSTVEALKEWQKQIHTASLEDTILLSLGWAKSFNSNFLVSQVELDKRLSEVEANQKSEIKYMANILSYVLGLDKRLKIIETKEK